MLRANHRRGSEILKLAIFTLLSLCWIIYRSIRFIYLSLSYYNPSLHPNTACLLSPYSLPYSPPYSPLSTPPHYSGLHFPLLT
mmetsp:Transcript_13710/g.13640  ORF Transcript_13710/g.13640 Transcript_13710/m.13640 type:complete len:83 (-) Transcript_13710:401-649(-)